MGGSSGLEFLLKGRFNSFQLNYSVIEKETLALIWALQHFDIYVGSSVPLVVYTDHNLFCILSIALIAD